MVALFLITEDKFDDCRDFTTLKPPGRAMRPRGFLRLYTKSVGIAATNVWQTAAHWLEI